MEGVEFSVAELDGRIVGNFTTCYDGLIYIPGLEEQWLIVTERRTWPTHRLDAAPRNVRILPGQLTILEYRNKPYPILEIRKTCSETDRPISGVRFRVYDSNMRSLGEFATNHLGIIRLTGMEPQTLFLRETMAASGFALDDRIHEVSVSWGAASTISVQNEPMATLRIRKVDSETGRALPGAAFLLYDSRNNIIGEFVSDVNGMIVFPQSLPAGDFQLREIRSPAGFVPLEHHVPVTLRPGETLEIEIPNVPERGRIQIIKRAAEANSITGQRAGAALAGATFEVVNDRQEVVDTITTDSRGIAVTRDLPLGRFAIRETRAPEFWLLYDGVFFAEIRAHDDLIQFEVLNYPADIAVTIEKRGPAQVSVGSVIRYDFSNISNSGNIPLDEFYFRDQLPDSVRLETLVTGTWSHRLNYRVEYRTNLQTTYRVWRNNLLTTANHELNVSDLRLAENEFVTGFRFIFGTVEPGFRETNAPYITARVLDTLEHEYRIINRADAGGRVGNEWAYDTTGWVTIAQAGPGRPLPQTGLQ